MYMLALFFYCSLSYFLCSYQFATLPLYLKIPHNFFGKIEIKFLKLIRKKYKFFSFYKLFRFIDDTKCFVCVLLSMLLFNKKEAHDIIAIVSYLGYCFPVFYNFKNNNRNFISVIFTSFLLDRITGISMLVAFFVSMKKSGYMSVSVVSFMVVGVIKTIIHILLLDSTDYLEMVFFSGIACIAIYDNNMLIVKLLLKTPTLEKNYFNSDLFNAINNEYIKLCEKCKKHKIIAFKERIINKFIKDKSNFKKKIKEFDKIFGIKNNGKETVLSKNIQKIKKRFDAKYKEKKREWYKMGFEKCKKYFFKEKEKNKDNSYYKYKKCGETENIYNKKYN